MVKKILSLALVAALMLCVGAGRAAANTKAEEAARSAEKLKAGLAKLGTGPDARIEVKTLEGTKLKGYVSEVADEHFIVVDAKTGAATKVTYPQVRQVKGNNLSSGTRIAITVVIAVAIIILIGALASGS